VDLVEQDQRGDAEGFCGDERAAEQVFRKTRLSAQHDDDLIQIRGQHLRFELIGAIEQVAALVHTHHDALVDGGGFIDHPIAHGAFAAFAPREALQETAPVAFDQ
ncbi:hypothetical protein COLO4_01797, partial [Corchorus olitorius]